MPNVERSTYHVTIGNTHLRDLINNDGEFWFDLPNGDEIHLRSIGVSDPIAEQIIEELQEQVGD